jgi:hypothetical protein
MASLTRPAALAWSPKKGDKCLLFAPFATLEHRSKNVLVTEVIMRSLPLTLIQLIAIVLLLASCEASTDSSSDAAQNATAEEDVREDESDEGDWNEEGLDDAERMRRAAIAAGIPMSDVVVPEISARTYTAGLIQVTVSGFFEIEASPALDTQASISDGGYTWIQYGASGEAAPNATVTIGNGDIGVSVAVGKFIATGTSTECTITTDVTPARVSGHLSCPKVTGYDQSSRTMGDVSIEIDFEANS